MKRIFLAMLAIALLISPMVYGQSLGEIARENREKQQKTDDADGTPPKVITNADLPKNTNPAPAPNETPAPASVQAADHRTAQQRMAEQRATGQWNRQIVAQKEKMANLQSRIDQLNAVIRAENGSAQYAGPNGRGQARQAQRVAELQLQFDEQRMKLLQMQEAARHAGMHTVVYDP